MRTIKRQEDGKAIKYLGVYFEAVTGWKVQQAVLKKKHATFMANLRHTALTVEEAVYLVNVKFIPTIKYPLQIALVPRSTFPAWDDKHIQVLRRVGKIAQALPKHIYFLPTDIGGYGLVSMVDVVDRMRLEMTLQALNDYAIQEDGTEELSNQAVISRAASGNATHPSTIGSKAMDRQ